MSDRIPSWFVDLITNLEGNYQSILPQYEPMPGVVPRSSAVLVLFGESEDQSDILLIERAADMRAHAGQPAFPGGMADPDDESIICTALREAQEETGLDPSGVHVGATLPALFLPPGGYWVTPILGYWLHPVAVSAQDPAEVARVARVKISDLVSPANRVTVVHPSGFSGPGFQVEQMLVWGFTALLLDRLLEIGGWAQPWRSEREVGAPT